MAGYCLLVALLLMSSAAGVQSQETIFELDEAVSGRWLPSVPTGHPSKDLLVI